MKTLDILQSHSYNGNVETAGSPLAYSYIRWSSAIQGTGDSLRRQKHMAEQWCQRNGVKLANDKIMVDAGVSAYRGKNLEQGAIGAFVSAAKNGRVPKGSFLLVESLDRLSRMRTVEVLSVFLEILRSGIVLVTLGEESEREFRWEHINERDLEDAIDEMRSSHRFSQKLSRRVTDAWIGRTELARKTGKAIPGNLPAWLYYDANGDLQIDEAKAEIVRRIFDMCISGYGLNAIAAFLNKAGVPPLALDKRKTIKNRSNFWTVTSVAYLLRYRAVYGDYHPKSGPILGIFPVIVSKEDFCRAEAARAKRLTTSKGRAGKNYTNLFKGIAKCHFCGEPMNIRNNTNKRLQLRCKGVGVKTCEAKNWNYEVFETAFLSFVKEIDLQAIIGSGSLSRMDEITGQIQALHGQRQQTAKSIQAIIGMVRKNPTLAESLQSSADEDQAKLDAISEQVKVLEAERNRLRAERSASAELLPLDVPRDFDGRTKIAEHIRTIVESVTLKRDSSSKFGTSFTVHFAGGGMRTVHVDYTNARKPFAVTHGHGGKDIIPDDLETAIEMQKYILDDLQRDAEWAIEAGGADGVKAVLEMLERMADLKDTMERQGRELGLVR